MNELPARRPRMLRKLSVGDRVRWPMPFVGTVLNGEVTERNGKSVAISWSNGLCGRFGFDNRLLWTLERI